MNRPLLITSAIVGTGVLFVGGFAFGRTLAGSDADPFTGGGDAVVISDARPVPRSVDPALPSGTTPGTDSSETDSVDAAPGGDDRTAGLGETTTASPIRLVGGGPVGASGGGGGGGTDTSTASGSGAIEPGAATRLALAAVLPADLAAAWSALPDVDPDRSDPDADPDERPTDETAGEFYLPPTRPVFLADFDDLDDDELDAAVEAAELAGEIDVEYSLDHEIDPEVGHIGVDLVDILGREGVIGLLGGGSPGLLGDLPTLRFVDPCADPDADSVPAGCPPGLGGTVLAPTGDGTGLPLPFHLFKTMYAFESGWNRCLNLGFRDGNLRGYVVTNNPGTVTMRYWSHALPDEPLEVVIEASPGERDRWTDARSRGFEIGSTDAQLGLQYCFELPIPETWPANHVVHFDVRAEDEFGTTDSFTTNFLIPGQAQVQRRPPITLRPDQYSNRAMLTVPYNQLRERVWISVLPQTTRERPLCSSVEGDLLAGRHPTAPGLGSRTVAAYPRSPGDGFIPGIDSAVVAPITIEEGRTARICVWITVPPRRSFDPPVIERREFFEVRAPRFLRTEIWLTGITADKPIDARSIAINPHNWSSRAPLPPSSNIVPREPLGIGWQRVPSTLVLAGGSNPTPDFTTLEVTGPGGQTALTGIATPSCLFTFFPCQASHQGTYDVPIPGTRDGESIGTMRLEVFGVAGPAGSPVGRLADDSWQVGELQGFEGARPGPGESRPIEIDLNNSELRGSVNRDLRGFLTAHLFFDRPVRVIEARPYTWTGGCGIDVVPEVRDDYSAQFLEYFPACLGQDYSLLLVVEDMNGERLDLTVDGLPSGGRPGFGRATVPTVDIRQFTVDITINRLGDGMQPRRLAARVFGHNWSIPEAARSCQSTSPVWTSRYAAEPPYGRRLSLYDNQTIVIDIFADGDGTACGLGGAIERRLEVNVPLDSIEWNLGAADPLRFDFSDAELDVQIDVRGLAR